MDTALLKNLGVNERIIQAIQKSYGDSLEELEILQDKSDLKLVLKRSRLGDFKPHVVTIHDFFEKKSFAGVAEAEVEYNAEKYKCRDIFEFLPSSDLGGSNLCLNGAKIQLPEALYRLLYFLAQEMRKTQSGWVYIQDLQQAGVIRSDGYQPFSRLRSALAGYLVKKNPKDLIESNGHKQYRLSVDPKNIRVTDGIKK